MFAFTCASVALAQLMQTQTIIPIQYRRASTVLSLFDSDHGRLVGPATSIFADDANSRLVVKGAAPDVSDIRKAVALIDVPRKRAEILIDVKAPADKLHYQQSVQLYAGDTWTTEQVDLGLKITLKVGDNLGRSVTIESKSDYKQHVFVSRFRLKSGESETETFGKALMSDSAPGVHVHEQTPIVTFKYNGLRGD